ncbi:MULTISPECIES: low molecular weight protein tyrosine phosphatase family protein [Dyella]|uniref:Phosphotyrosine protein phosphatase n=2 Tax=Dyella TaxID=231454 RepID=A0A4R0YNZ9_9GAMM|nr:MULTISPECIES: low molecular weight protein tyrosine phosphatase family protein [Dyella]TBR36843.1 phosphotyrosine protein phosphatase [Dyella terrae]TCI08066.1 phosphotyrosine protein phosphatase [Dyella soli]
MQHILFLCSRNRLRSPTAEAIFAGRPGVETASAGLAPDAETPLDADMLAWANLIVVMERQHRNKLTQRFAGAIQGKRIVCLDIPDRYDYMQPELVSLLEKKCAPLLAR